MTHTATMTHTPPHSASPASAPRERLLRIAEVRLQVGISSSQIYRLIALGQFPRSVPLPGRGAVWPESEIQAWIAERIAARRGQ